MLVNDGLVTDTEAETHAFAESLGGEERVENMGLICCSYSRPVIGDRDPNAGAAPVLDYGGSDGDDGTRGQGAFDRFDGVEQQVHEDLVKVAGVAIDEGQVGIVPSDGDLAVVELALKQEQGVFDADVQVRRFTDGFVEAGKVPQGKHHLPNSFSPRSHRSKNPWHIVYHKFKIHFLQQILNLRRETFWRLFDGLDELGYVGEIFFDVGQISVDEANGIVDFVGKPGDDPSEAGHFFALNQLGLGLLQFSEGFFKLVAFFGGFDRLLLGLGVEESLLNRNRQLIGHGLGEFLIVFAPSPRLLALVEVQNRVESPTGQHRNNQRRSHLIMLIFQILMPDARIFCGIDDHDGLAMFNDPFGNRPLGVENFDGGGIRGSAHFKKRLAAQGNETIGSTKLRRRIKDKIVGFARLPHQMHEAPIEIKRIKELGDRFAEDNFELETLPSLIGNVVNELFALDESLALFVEFGNRDDGFGRRSTFKRLFERLVHERIDYGRIRSIAAA